MCYDNIWLNDDQAQVAHINLGKYGAGKACGEGGVIESGGRHTSARLRSFIEINYSPGPHTVT